MSKSSKNETSELEKIFENIKHDLIQTFKEEDLQFTFLSTIEFTNFTGNSEFCETVSQHYAKNKIKKLKKYTSEQINNVINAYKGLLDVTSSCLTSLNNLNIPTSSWDPIIIFMVVSKLDHESLRQWEINISGIPSNGLPTWSDLVLFLESRFRTLEMIDSNKPMQRTPQQNFRRPEKVKSFATVHDEKSDMKSKCTMCSGNHYLYQCKNFGQLLPRARLDFAQTKSLCFNCLAPTHSVKNCRQSTCCRRCGRRHHSLLHIDKEIMQGPVNNSENIHTTPKRPTEENVTTSTDREVKIVANFAKEEEIFKPTHVLLATAIVRAYSRSGQSTLLRALIDQGSQGSFVTEETVQLLGLKRVPVSGCVSGLGNGQLKIKYMVSIHVESKRNSNDSIQVTAYVLKSIVSRIPSSKMPSPNWLDLETLSLADSGFTSPGKIDLLLGAEVYSQILLGDMRKHPQENLLAQNTIFGWVISGRVSQSALATKPLISLHVQIKEDDSLKQFWELENEPNTIQRKLSKLEQRCEEFYAASTFRNKEGRFVVKLPFNNQDPECQYGRLKDIAKRRFQLLEKKFQKYPNFKKVYCKVIQEYLDLNHMVKIEEVDSRAVYLPHHAVVREDKETTKVRIVFDASCKGVNGVSLNDNLLVGPKLQEDLRHILMRWRRFPICIVADVIKMYRQVRVNQEDTRFQRIIWRVNPEEPFGHYELLTLTFGTACAPHLAVKSLQKLADEEKCNYPIAAEIAMRDYFVDDLMTCCRTEDEAIEIYNQMNNMLKSGGFQLQKWSSNSKRLLQFIDQN